MLEAYNLTLWVKDGTPTASVDEAIDLIRESLTDNPNVAIEDIDYDEDYTANLNEE